MYINNQNACRFYVTFNPSRYRQTMRLLVGFAFVFVSIALIQGQLVVPQFNNLNAIISLIPQIQVY